MCEGLQKTGITAAAIHGNKSQKWWQEALAGFQVGGEGLAIKHVLRNSIAFNNNAIGITNNRCFFYVFKLKILTKMSDTNQIKLLIKILRYKKW